MIGHSNGTASLAGKTVLITGATSGIGFEASIALAAMGADVVMLARDPRRGEAALAEVRRRVPDAGLSLMQCDIGSLTSIRAFAGEFLRQHSRLDILINNAGVANKDRLVTVDAIEETFAVNHLGHFLLTNLLLDLLVATAPARIVNVSSVQHFKARLDFENLQFQRGGYSIVNSYALSKLANVLFTRELARRLDGTGVTAVALHPGRVRTGLWDRLPAYAKPFVALVKPFFIPPAAGARNVVHLATSHEVEAKNGAYYHRTLERTPSRLALDPHNARRLWDVSAELARLGPLRAATAP